jgi:hypothetical protein
MLPCCLMIFHVPLYPRRKGSSVEVEDRLATAVAKGNPDGTLMFYHLDCGPVNRLMRHCVGHCVVCDFDVLYITSELHHV